MPTEQHRFNPAGRVLDLVQAAKSINPQKTGDARLGWKQVYGLPNLGPAELLEAIAERHMLVRRQLVSVREHLSASQQPTHYWHDAVARVEQAFGLDLLHASWQTIHQILNDQPVGKWDLFPVILPEEPRIEEKALDRIRGILDRLRACLRKEEMPEELRKVLQKQLALIDNALLRYEFCGVTGIEEPVATAVGYWVSSSDLLRREGKRRSVRRIALLWTKVQRAARHAPTVFRFILALADGVNDVASIVERVQPMLGSGDAVDADYKFLDNDGSS